MECSFPGIADISVKISRCVKSFHVVHLVTYSKLNANKFNLAEAKNGLKICIAPTFHIECKKTDGTNAANGACLQYLSIYNIIPINSQKACSRKYQFICKR